MDTRWLEQRARGWYAVKDVPRPLQASLGKKRLIRSLHTQDHRLALARRHAVLAEFEGQIAGARKDASGLVGVPAGLAWRDTLQRLDRGEPAMVKAFGGERRKEWHDGAEVEFSAEEVARDNASLLLGEQADTFRARGDLVGASALLDLAHGRATPLLHHVEAWLAEGGSKGALKERTRSQYRTDVGRLEKWANGAGVAPTVEAFTKRIAGRYVTEAIVSPALDPMTGNRRVSAASAYWRWMVKRGVVETNPWTGQSLAKRAHDGTGSRSKRPFTDAEVVALLAGNPDEELADAMRVLALSGMRLEEVYRLTVATCTGGWFNVREAKTRAGIRRVPVHSVLAGIVARRCEGKAPTAFLFHERGPAPASTQRSAPVSKRFGRYRQTVGVHDAKEGRRHSAVDAHSFRRWFVSAARNAGQDRAMVAAVVGHEAGNITDDVYSSGPSEALRQAVVEAVRLPTG